jgi:hypothetical protein
VYRVGWNNSCTSIDLEHARFIRGSYDSGRKLAETAIGIFRAIGEWRRTDITFHQRFYPADHYVDLGLQAVFAHARCYDASKEIGIDGAFSDGRALPVARRKARRDPAGRSLGGL